MSRIVWADGTVDEQPGIRGDRYVVAEFTATEIRKILFQRSTLKYALDFLGPFSPDTQRDPETGIRYEFVYREIV